MGCPNFFTWLYIKINEYSMVQVRADLFIPYHMASPAISYNYLTANLSLWQLNKWYGFQRKVITKGMLANIFTYILLNHQQKK